jgi:hypothetical protein
MRKRFGRRLLKRFSHHACHALKHHGTAEPRARAQRIAVWFPALVVGMVFAPMCAVQHSPQAAEIKNRGTADVYIVDCDGSRGYRWDQHRMVVSCRADTCDSLVGQHRSRRNPQAPDQAVVAQLDSSSGK